MARAEASQTSDILKLIQMVPGVSAKEHRVTKDGVELTLAFSTSDIKDPSTRAVLAQLMSSML